MIKSYSDKIKSQRLNNSLMERLQKLYESQIKIYVKM